MKKFMSVVVLLLFLVVSFSACSSTKYKYADNWDIADDSQVISAIEYIEKYAKSETSDYDELLKKTKSLVRDYVPYSDLLEWDKFEKLQTVRVVSFEESDVLKMSYEELFLYSSYMALYDEESDSIYILPGFYETSTEERLYVFAHEIIHSLVNNHKHPDDSAVVEGLVDYLAANVCTKLSVDISPKYQESILCLGALMRIYGKDAAVRAICEDRIVEMIDNSTKPGMAEKLNLALLTAHNTESTADDVKEAVCVEIDILAHAAKHQCVNIDDWIDNVCDLYASIDITIRDDYFKKI